jgi:hypothetical protein
VNPNPTSRQRGADYQIAPPYIDLQITSMTFWGESHLHRHHYYYYPRLNYNPTGVCSLDCFYRLLLQADKKTTQTTWWLLLFLVGKTLETTSKTDRTDPPASRIDGS